MEQDLLKRIQELERQFNLLRASTTIPRDIDGAFRERFGDFSQLPEQLESAPLTAITSPSGGATIDSQARSAIDSIITTLEGLGLISPN